MNGLKLEPSEYKTIIINDERMAILNRDPVWSFFNKVNATSTSKSYWEEDFRRAFYDAAQEEINKHCVALIELSEKSA